MDHPSEELLDEYKIQFALKLGVDPSEVIMVLMKNKWVVTVDLDTFVKANQV